jgi:hypothetical protein
MEGQLRRKGHSDEPEWQSLGENANATFEHYKGSGTSPDHKAYSRMEMSGKDNQIRKQEIMSFIFKSQPWEPPAKLHFVLVLLHISH